MGVSPMQHHPPTPTHQPTHRLVVSLGMRESRRPGQVPFDGVPLLLWGITTPHLDHKKKKKKQAPKRNPLQRGSGNYNLRSVIPLKPISLQNYYNYNECEPVTIQAIFPQGQFYSFKVYRINSIKGEKENEICYSGAEFFLFSATPILCLFCANIRRSADSRRWRSVSLTPRVYTQISAIMYSLHAHMSALVLFHPDTSRVNPRVYNSAVWAD